MRRTFFLDGHGCAKNQVDAENMIALLTENGWSSVDDSQDADVIIVNSCGFIESAKRESLEAVLSFKQVYPDKKVLLAGCLAQRYGAELASELLEADALVGNTDGAFLLPGMEAALASTHGALVSPADPTGAREFSFYRYDRPLLSLPGSAYVKITEGCDNRCTFCAIPLIRGPLRSRSIPSIVEECQALLDRGIRELCLIGQDLGSYGKDGAGGTFPPGTGRLGELLTALSRLGGTFWIRLLYIHPDNFPLSILDLCRQDPRILPYFDIPFQHASVPILRSMNRRGNSETYLELIRTIRAALPDATLRSTFLVGFPGETDLDFQALADFQGRAQLDWLGIFTYSREEGTPAYSLKGRVAKKIAEERKRWLEDAQVPITEARMDRFVGRTETVLVEERVENEEGLYLGRSACQAPEVDGATVISAEANLSPGSLIGAKIFSRSGFDLDAAYRDARS
jgi:ribosomal protein S12 methylthiotransferase